MTVVWNYFRLKKEKNKTAECSLCNTSVSQGDNKVGNFSTMNLIKHLQKYHGKDVVTLMKIIP